MEKPRLIDTIDLNELIEQFLSTKKKDFTFPAQEKIFTNEIKNVSNNLKHMKFPFQSEYHVDRINFKNQLQVVKEAMNLLNYLSVEDKIDKKITSFLTRIEVKETDTLKFHTTSISYQDKTKPIIEAIEIAKPESSIQSIALARTIIGAIKNENPKEFYNMWKTDYTIPYFLEELFAKKMSKEKGNEDILEIMQFLRMWTIQVQNSYYRSIQSICNHQVTGAELYKARLYATYNIYPIIKGYIDALKLLKIVENQSGNIVPILRQIKNVIEHTKTTDQMLEDLNINRFDSRQIIKERCYIIQNNIRRKRKK